MPFKEAFFWVSITVFGTGLYFFADHKKLAIPFTIVGLCGIAWSIWIHHRPNARQPRLWFSLVALTWLAVGYDYYDRNNKNELSEFDAQKASIVTGYGQDSPESCFMNVNGSSLLSRQADYKTAMACFVYDGNTDILDAPYLQVSNLYDIKEGNISMHITYQPYFVEYTKRMNAIGVNVALLNVPNGVQTSQFSTLRQARALGVKIPDLSTAKSVIMSRSQSSVAPNPK